MKRENNEKTAYGSICVNSGFGRSLTQAAFLLLLFAAVSFAEVSISSCGDLSASNENYTLNQSITGTIAGTSVCLNITASNITLDCNGFNMTGNGSGTIGIYTWWLENSVIKNCVILNYSTGSWVIMNNSLLSNITIANNRYAPSSTAVLVDYSENSSISSLHTYWGTYGIYGNGLPHLHVYNSTFHNHTYGFYSMSSGVDGIGIYNSTFYSNTYGFFDLYCIYTFITGSRFYNNTYGFYAEGSDSISITSTNLSNNSYGVYLYEAGWYSNASAFSNVTANNNTNYGFYYTGVEYYGTVGTTTTNSLSCGNGLGGYYFSADSTNNAGSGNQGNVTDLDSNTGFSSGACTAPPPPPPSVALDSPAQAALLNSSPVTLNWTPSDFNANPTCNVTRNAALLFSGTCTNGTSCTSSNDTPDGTYYWNATCYTATNTSTSATRSFTVDAHAPAITINSPASDSTLNSSLIAINITVADANINYTDISIIDSIGGTANSTTSASTGTFVVQLGVPADGVYNITATAHDLAGNSNSTLNANIAVDSSAPSVSIQSPANATYNGTSVSLNFTAGGAAYCWYSLDGGNSTALPGCGNTTVTAGNGSHSITVYANDSVGNTGSAGVSFSVNAPPRMTMKLGVRSQDIAPIYLNGISLDGEYYGLEPSIYFKAGERKVASFSLPSSLCQRPGQLLEFDEVILYYGKGMLENIAQVGSVPLVTRCP